MRFGVLLLGSIIGGCGTEPSPLCRDLPTLLGKDYTAAASEQCESYARHRHPPKEILDRLDAALSQNACIGDLSKWERLYSFNNQRGSWEVDESKIQFEFREAGRYDFKSGRRTTLPLEWVNIDDRYYNNASGYFDVRTRTLVIERCRPNVSD